MLSKGYKFKKVSQAKLDQANAAGKLGRAVNMALAIQRRQEYNTNPNRCVNCDAPILVPLGDLTSFVFAAVKIKRFCDHSCCAKYNNRIRGYIKSKTRSCSKCGIDYFRSSYTGTKCPECRLIPYMSVWALRTKAEMAEQAIRSHARVVLFKAKEKKCEICGYSIRVDCCHIKAIKEFSLGALLSEINAESNLKALCPNHHAELDLGILKI